MGKVYDILNLAKNSGEIDGILAMELLACSDIELIYALGITNLAKPNLSLSAQLTSPNLHQHLLQVVSVINYVHAMGVPRRDCFEWFINEPIPALGHITAREALLDDYFDELREYLSGINLGGYA
jgi:hypothetical protein